jgi:hypothetical protein
MERKLGHYVIAILILVFMVTTFSRFINEVVEKEQVSVGDLGTSLSNIGSDLDDNTKDLQSSIKNKTDDSSQFTTNDENSQIDQRGTDAGGVMNILSKNIVAQFLKEVNEKIPGMGIVLGFIMAIVGVIGSILFLRMIIGEGKI